MFWVTFFNFLFLLFFFFGGWWWWWWWSKVRQAHVWGSKGGIRELYFVEVECVTWSVFGLPIFIFIFNQNEKITWKYVWLGYIENILIKLFSKRHVELKIPILSFQCFLFIYSFVENVFKWKGASSIVNIEKVKKRILIDPDKDFLSSFQLILVTFNRLRNDGMCCTPL